MINRWLRDSDTWKKTHLAGRAASCLSGALALHLLDIRRSTGTFQLNRHKNNSKYRKINRSSECQEEAALCTPRVNLHWVLNNADHSLQSWSLLILNALYLYLAFLVLMIIKSSKLFTDAFVQWIHVQHIFRCIRTAWHVEGEDRDRTSNLLVRGTHSTPWTTAGPMIYVNRFFPYK